ncbi:hypothetical protein NFI96_033585, partial [Prochilodus magdalenae]
EVEESACHVEDTAEYFVLLEGEEKTYSICNMDKRKVHFEKDFEKGRVGALPFKAVYKQRSSTQIGKVSSTQESRHRGSQRREYLCQLTKPYSRQRSLLTHSGDQRRLDLKTHLLNLVVKDLQPLSLVEDKGFQNFVAVLHPCIDIPLSASWIRAKLLHMYEQTKLKVQKEVSFAKDLVLSAEMWVSSKDMSYLTVTCHYINESWKLKSYMLETAHLLGEHTPENIHQQLWRISQAWNIVEKIQVVVVNVDGMKKQKARWTYMPCFGHTLNKVFFEAMDNPVWRDLLKKCRRIVAVFHQNGEALGNVQLTQAPGFDWLPVLTMLESILDNWSSIATEFMEKRVDDLWLNEKERLMMTNAVMALKAIRNVVEKMGKRGYSSVSNIIPLCEELQMSLERLDRTGNKVAQELAKRCNHHMGSIKLNSWFAVSTALDPRFKSSVLQNFDKIKAHIKEEMHRQEGGATGGGCNTVHGSQMGYEDLALQRYYTESDGTMNPLDFWANNNSFRELTAVARKHLTVVSTAVPLECVTQQDQSQLVYNRRRCVELENVNVMLFLNSNQAQI